MQSRRSGPPGSGVLSWLRGTVAGTDEELAYTCRTCDAAFSVEHYRCPECGGFSVER